MNRASQNPHKTYLRRYWSLLCQILAVAATILVLWSPLRSRSLGLLDPFSFNGDALQHIAPLWFVHVPTAQVSDYTLRYYLEAILPPLFKGIYSVLTVWLTPPAASKVVTVTLSIFFIGISSATARRLAGTVAGYLTLFLATAGVLKNLYFMGGIQRSFGFCLAALALHLVCRGNLLPVAALGVVAASLYPAAAVLILTVLGLLVFLPSTYRGSLGSWSIAKRVGLLAACAILTGIVVTPQLSAGGRYGQRLSINAAREFEEWGPHGRYTPGDRGVPVNIWNKLLVGATAALSPKSKEKVRPLADRIVAETEPRSLSAEHATLVVVFGSLAGGLLALARRRFFVSPEALRCGVFLGGTIVAFTVAAALFPLLYIPARYLALGATASVSVIFPALWCIITTSLIPTSRRRLSGLASLIVGVAILASLGWHTLSTKKMPTAVGNRVLFSFIQGLPADTVIASWPRGIANMVPLFTGRSVLVFEEGHQIFHREFLEEMRRRTRALIAAYAATDIGPIETLRREYNISYILINRRHLTRAPDYFAPFNAEMRRSLEAVGSIPRILRTLAKQRAVFTSNDYIIIDIRDLSNLQQATASATQ